MKFTVKKIFVLFFIFLFLSSGIWSDTKTISEKNTDLYIYKPEIKSLPEEQEWIIDFIQNLLFDDISKNTEISVFFIDNTLDEDLSGEETDAAKDSDEDETFESVSKSGDLLNKSIYNLTVTGSYNTIYDLSFKIIEKNSNQIVAEKTISKCSPGTLESGKLLKETAVSLLTGLGISFSDSYTQLIRTDNANLKLNVEAQQLFAQGLYAQRKGLTVEAMNCFIRAKMKDSTLLNLSSAMNITSDLINAGSLGEQSRNLINARKSFIKLLDETEAFFEKNVPYTIVYNPELKLGAIDYEKEKAEYKFKSALVLKYDAKEICDNILLLYRAQEDSVNWNLDQRIKNLIKEKAYVYIQYELHNNQGKKLAVTRKKIPVTKKDVYLNEYSFKVPSKYDTRFLVFSISATKFSEKNIKVSNKKWWASETGNVNIEKYQIRDYENQFIRPRCQLEQSDVRGISYVTLSQSINLKQNTSLLNYFGENLSELCESYYPDYSTLDKIIYTKEEKKKIDKYKTGTVLNGNYIISEKLYVTDNSVPWPRKKEEFRKHLRDFNLFEYKMRNDNEFRVYISPENFTLLQAAQIEKDEFLRLGSIEVGYYHEYQEWSEYYKKYVKRTKWVPTGSIERYEVTQKLADILGWGTVSRIYYKTEKDGEPYTYDESKNNLKFLNTCFSFESYLEKNLIQESFSGDGNTYSLNPANDLTCMLLKKAVIRYFDYELPDDRANLKSKDLSLINRVIRRNVSGNLSVYVMGDKDLKGLKKIEGGKELAKKISEDSNYFYFYQTEKAPLRYSQRKRFDLKIPSPQISFTSPDYLALGVNLIEFDYPIAKHIYTGIEGGLLFISDMDWDGNVFEDFADGYINDFFPFLLGKIGFNFNIDKGCMVSAYLDCGWYNGRTVGAGIELMSNKFRYNNFFVDYNIGYVMVNKLTNSDRLYDRFSLGYVVTFDLNMKH